MRRARELAGNERGFTLVEFLMVMLFIGAIFGAFSALLSTTINSSTEVQSEDVLQTEARGVMDRISQELRQAYTGDPSVNRIVTMTSTQLTFYTPDRQTPFHLLQVSYRLNGNTIERAYGTSTNTSSTGPPWTWPSPVLGSFARQVSSVQNTSLFTYYDASGAVTSSPTAVDSVGMTVTVSNNPTDYGKRYTYTTSVTLRAIG